MTTQTTIKHKPFGPLNSQKGVWKLINGQLAKVITREDGTESLQKFYPKSFHLHAKDHMPTGGPNQHKTYTPKPKMGRKKAKQGMRS